jgi:hypothetical protein
MRVFSVRLPEETHKIIAMVAKQFDVSKDRVVETIFSKKLYEYISHKRKL